MMKTTIGVLLAAVLSGITVANASPSFFTDGHVYVEQGTAIAPNEVAAFTGTVNITATAIELLDDNGERTGQYVSALQRGTSYVFWSYLEPSICAPFWMQYAVFRGGKQVARLSARDTGGQCSISALGIAVTVPDTSPYVDFTWGAMVATHDGRDIDYPSAFSIVPPGDIIGTWNAEFDWECNGDPAAMRLTFDDDGTFTSGTNYGVWSLSGYQVSFTYQTGGMAQYTGSLNDTYDYMSGTMTDSEGDTGCWSAVPEGAVPPLGRMDNGTEASGH